MFRSEPPKTLVTIGQALEHLWNTCSTSEQLFIGINLISRPIITRQSPGWSY
jgi:hypothetical protein